MANLKRRKLGQIKQPTYGLATILADEATFELNWAINQRKCRKRQAERLKKRKGLCAASNPRVCMWPKRACVSCDKLMKTCRHHALTMYQQNDNMIKYCGRCRKINLIAPHIEDD